MNDKEITKEYWMKKIFNKECTIAIAAESLGLSIRQVKRIKKGYLEKGIESIIHGNLNRKPKHAITEELKKQIIELKLSDKYRNANIAHFTELIEEDELKDIKIKYETIFKILKTHGIKSPKKHRKIKQHHRRKRLDNFGKMLQIDATPYDWFDDGIMNNMHGAIDDSTGKITGLYITKNECLEGYFNMMKVTLKEFGRPVSMYSDRHLILHPLKEIPLLDQLEGAVKNETNFSRAMKELNINMIRAYSPQAKGRIERLWQTLQSRLPVEFKIHNINTIEKANIFLKKYIHRFNKKFSIQAKDQISLFNKLPEGIDLKYILCRKEKRRLNRGGTFSLANKLFKVNTKNIPFESTVNILISNQIGITVEYKGKYYCTELFEDNAKSDSYTGMAIIIDQLLSESLKEKVAV